MDVIRNADYIVDLGPEAGTDGGHLVYQGDTSGLKKCKTSVTGRYM
jgi:excinuclease ABC subunit A